MGKVYGSISRGTFDENPCAPEVCEDYLGGTGNRAWSACTARCPGVGMGRPENRIIMASGPFAGPRCPGRNLLAGAKGPDDQIWPSRPRPRLLGAYIKLSGYDAVIGSRSPRWLYLAIDDGKRGASGCDRLAGEGYLGHRRGGAPGPLDDKRLSVFGIGPAGGAAGRYAVVAADRGHILLQERLRRRDGGPSA